MIEYEKFKEIYDEIDELIAQNVSSSTPKFQAWRVKAERFLLKKYGEKSYEVKNFKSFSFSLMCYSFDTSENDFIKACKDDLCSVKAIFEQYLEDMQDENELLAENEYITKDYSKVFIVHGHDGELKEAVARVIERQGIKPIILSEQVNRGATIIEKIEVNSNVNGAICLFTSDDLGRAKKESTDNPRARQNVVFEAGYFVGKLGRENVILISDGNIELPSDLQGVVYSNKSDWKINVLKELKAIGYYIDYNKLDE